jgi:hypothetical protein
LARYAGASGATPYYIVCTDSAGKTATGYLGAAGAGETTSEVLTNGDFETWVDPSTPTGWTKIVGSGATFNQDTVDLRPGTAGSSSFRLDAGPIGGVGITQTNTLVPGGLYRVNFWYKNSAADKVSTIRIYDSTSTKFLRSTGAWAAETYTITLPISTLWTTYTIYFNAHADYTSYVLYFRATSTACSFWVDDAAFERIDDPDSTGLHVYDDANSSTRGWKEQEAGFDPILISSYAVYSTIPNIAAITPLGGIANVITV